MAGLADTTERPIDAARGAAAFSYEEAFSRNLGWVTAGEQQMLRGKRIAIAGMGGVGGSHLLTLTRMGIGAFRIADFDVFELANFNRQAGAATPSLGKPKVETLARMARAINPTLELGIFPQGVDEANLDSFLAGVDVYVDALDFFVLDLRRRLFARCYERGIPAVTAAPVGMGTAYLVFMPGGMTFERYFRLEGLSPERQQVNFALGLVPRGFQRSYLMDASRVDLRRKRAPSMGLACELCAGVTAAEVLKILLKRGRVRAAPRYHQFDAYRSKWARGWLPGGNANPLQRLKLALAYRLSARMSRDALPAPRPAKTDCEAILDQARWAPSGDNLQPWRFEILGPDRVAIQVKGTGDVYDYNDGEPTLLSAGFLLETLRIAASARQRSLRWRHLGRTGGVHRIAVDLPPAPHAIPDELLPFIAVRSVDRRAYRTAPLGAERKLALARVLGEALTVEWHETAAARWRAAWVNAYAGDIRLRLPEAFEVHRAILDWERNFSPTGIPAWAVGLDPLAQRLTRWALGDWRRLAALNRLGGTLLPRLELDLVPGLLCAAHFTVRMKAEGEAPGRPERLLAAGQALQRFWLTATRLGLVMQPTLASLCFAEYGRTGAAFTRDDRLAAKARRLAARMAAADGGGDRVVFRGRLGEPVSRRISARSTRRDLDELVVGGAFG